MLRRLRLFTFACLEKEAVTELKHVVDMLLDYHLEQVNNEQIISNKLAARIEKQAAQIQ